MKRDPSRRYHDRVAKKYDAIYEDAFWEFHDEITWGLIKPHLPRVLPAACADLGCGTGKWGLKLLKSGFDVTFLDHSGGMIEEVRGKLDSNPRARRATLVVGDIVSMPELETGRFQLVTAMGDPLSICTDPAAAVREFARITAPGGVVCATVDNKLAALDHYIARGKVEELAEFVGSGETRWLTENEQERFPLKTFTPREISRLFEANGFEVLAVTGKTILPVRSNRALLEDPGNVDRLVELERALQKDPASAGKAGHLQVTGRRRGGEEGEEAVRQ
jgi:ubiquinone/menaquinone biosynthesis C-methylase UbiE